MSIQPHTVAMIASNILVKSERMDEDGDLFNRHFKEFRKRRMREIASLAVDLALALDEEMKLRKDGGSTTPE